jgi:hypothetical protein
VPSFALVSAARLASLATGRGGMPTPDEWPFLAAVLVAVGFFGARFLIAVGLTRVEAVLVACVSPLLVVVDAPLGVVAPGTALAANFAGCVIPVVVGAKVLVDRRWPILEMTLLLAAAIAAAFLSSHVVPGRGVMLQYRIPALVVALAAAALFHSRPGRAGAAAFAAGAFGVLVGADLLRMRELGDSSGAGRVILGGAGLLDGIFLVALLAAGIASTLSTVARLLTGRRAVPGGTA